MENEILTYINKVVRAEKGNKVTIDDRVIDTDLDSLGLLILFVELDWKYKYFRDTPNDSDPFNGLDYKKITIKQLVDKCMSTNI